MEELLMRWVASWALVGKVSVDGKEMRGSKRARGEQAAIEVVTAAGQDLQVVLGQVGVGEGSELEAAVQLLRGLPLQGKVVTVDAGLLHRDLVDTVLDQGGDYLGLIKDNEPGAKLVVDEWIEPQIFPPRSGTSSG